MGRKKTSVRDEESAPVGGGKSKKKAFVINDDEYSIGTDLSEEPLEEKVVPPVNNKKGKKGGSKREEDEEVDDIKFGEDDVDEDEPVMKFAGKKKSKGKKSGNNNSFSSSAFGLLGEDEEEDGEDDKNDDDEEEEVRLAFSGKKKTSKNKKNSGKGSSAFDLLQEEEDSEEGEDDTSESVVAFSGKKKASKSKKSGGNVSSAFDLLQEGEEEGEEGVESPKEYEDEDVTVSFTGKKKKKKPSKASGKLFSAAVLDEENEDDASASKAGDDLEDGGEDEQDELSALNFSGKKKSSKKKNASANTASEMGNDRASSDFMESRQPPAESKIENQTIDNTESSKNKKKKKKGGKGAQEEEEDLDKILAELGAAPSVSKPVAASLPVPDVPPNQPELQEVVGDKEGKEEEPLESVKDAVKNKKKKKKGGKNAQDEEDLDKILSEIDGAPPSEPVPSLVEAPTEIEETVGDKEAEDEGPAESAAAKKKKKKKGKDKKPAAEEKQEETKAEAINKISDKKVPKHVREMQERLAKLKEAEERKKREEEERLRKEEEERRRQEELERLAEEKKRLKKEKEKEKLMKKKQEGKLLTGKQKEEARRLEAMRNQILAAGGMQILNGESASKRPVYQKKKPKPQAQSNGATAVDPSPVDVVESSVETEQEVASEISSVEPENVQETAPLSEKDLLGATDVVEDNGVADEEDDDDDEDWDAKSWDDADLKLPGKGTFSDEEVDSEPEPLPKKEVKVARPATTQDVQPPSKATKPGGLNEKASSTVQRVPEKIKEHKSKDIEPEVASKNNDKARVVPDNEVSNSQNGQNLRSPICCIMGHVDTGKTKLLDCIRGTNVQEGEAGGITQQIGATYFPADNIRERTKELKADAKLNVPGLLVIDTPGHESFTNLRSRGSGLCDIAILVVDIMHGLEPQTIESLNLLKMRNTEFIVALNKVDRLYGWKTCRNAPITKAMKQQSKDVILEFNTRLTQVITQFKEQGLNTELYYKNKEMGETFSIVPTSAISGEGIPDLLLLLVQWAQKTMINRLTYSDEVQCTVLEVKVIEGHGTTIDVVLVNGVLHEGDQIIVCGLQGPIVTNIRALLTPHPMKELRVKGTFLHHKEIKAAQGIKITAQGLEHAIAGTSLYIVKPGDDLEEIKETAMADMKSVMNRIDKSGEGVYVQASTLGSLEALLEFLKSPAVSIPVSGISIGPVHKKDVMKASVMLEKKKEYGTILAFDVKVTQEARDLADELGVKIFIADIIYHLFDQFKAYIDNLKEEKKKQASEEAVFPCVLKIIPNCVFNTKDPIVLGVDVVEGIAKVGTPICVPQRDFVDIGRVASIEKDHKPVDYAKKGQKVAIKIIGSNPEEQQKMFGRHFEIEDELVSKISRNSLDALKEHYRDDLSVDEKRLLFKLKSLFKIP